jgi:tetratricopeptide (TPR) repeat protein
VISVKPIHVVAAALLFAPFATAQQTTPQPPQPATPAAPASGPAVHHEANFDAERAQANQLFLAGKHLEALPLYEDLCRQDQANPAFAERHGEGLMEKSYTLADPKERNAMFMQGIQELERAERLGDNSPVVEDLLGGFAKTPMGVAAGGSMGGLPLTAGWYYNGNAKAQPLLEQGQAVFGKKDYPNALKFYLAAAAADPKLYTAALYAGDVYERMKDYTNAGVWFAKAIAIDPDRETAYRYWGDTLMASGDTVGAKVKFEQALAAEPYNRMAFQGLRQWAIQTRTSIVYPHVQRPNFPYKDGKFTDASLGVETGDGRGSWLVYGQSRLARDPHVIFNEWVMAGSVNANPQEDFVPNGYVHTLAEEVVATEAMLADVKKKLASGTVTEEKLDPGLKNLLALEKDNMLEPFIVISFNDAGIRHGYPEYRAAHRDQVIAYIDRYLIGPPLPANSPSPYVRVQP